MSILILLDFPAPLNAITFDLVENPATDYHNCFAVTLFLSLHSLLSNFFSLQVLYHLCEDLQAITLSISEQSNNIFNFKNPTQNKRNNPNIQKWSEKKQRKFPVHRNTHLSGTQQGSHCLAYSLLSTISLSRISLTRIFLKEETGFFSN